MAATPGRGEILSLLRSFMRIARQFSDYNIREYTKRRVIDGFRENKTLTDASSISAAFADGTSQFEVARRQALVSLLYPTNVKSIMDVKKTHNKI